MHRGQKLRRLRYFYGNTELIKRRFDFTGIPHKILLGRLIAIGIYVADLGDFQLFSQSHGHWRGGFIFGCAVVDSSDHPF